MGKKKKKIEVFVYNPDAELEDEVYLEPSEQRLRIRIEKKQRGGKVATIISGFKGEGIDKLAKKLKSQCGVGGNAKEGEIILQGDLKNKAIDLLKSWGYRDTK